MDSTSDKATSDKATSDKATKIKKEKETPITIMSSTATTDITDIYTNSPCMEPEDVIMIELFKNNNIDRLLQIMRARMQLESLRRNPGAKQRSQEWYDLRKGMLTASDLAQAIGRGKYGNRNNLLTKKAWPDSATFWATAAMKWGTMCEAVALQCYVARNNNVETFEFGLIPHPTLSHFGASPDSITSEGIMVELKCPSSRKIVAGEVPDHYYLQIQGQLEVCGLDECDYVECSIERIASQAKYEALEITDHQFHGAIIELMRSDDEPYIYSPPHLSPHETTDWVEEKIQTIDFINITYWALAGMNIVRVQRDRELWKTLEPQITQFWTDVELAKTTEQVIKSKTDKSDNGSSVGKKRTAFAFKDDTLN